MTREAKIDEFWNSFSVPAFVNTNVPNQKDRPVAYITYQIGGGFFGDTQIIQVNVWYRTSSEKKINAIVREIEEKISRGGKVLSYDGKAIWLKRGTPWVQAMMDEDPEIKRRYLVVEIEDWR